ncbi:MAG: hypothetical protein KatS3mg126_1136 [Lysobacteraceae bacterium]|nr:MAG: hypothetical protein KatS3mg126_1136 [Xanthomonadaceae bacterium]
MTDHPSAESCEPRFQLARPRTGCAGRPSTLPPTSVPSSLARAHALSAAVRAHPPATRPAAPPPTGCAHAPRAAAARGRPRPHAVAAGRSLRWRRCGNSPPPRPRAPAHRPGGSGASPRERNASSGSRREPGRQVVVPDPMQVAALPVDADLVGVAPLVAREPRVQRLVHVGHQMHEEAQRLRPQRVRQRGIGEVGTEAFDGADHAGAVRTIPLWPVTASGIGKVDEMQTRRPRVAGIVTLRVGPGGHIGEVLALAEQGQRGRPCRRIELALGEFGDLPMNEPAPGLRGRRGERKRGRHEPQQRASDAHQPASWPRAASSTASTVMPKWRNRSSAGADAPKRSMPTTAPSRPTYLRQ